MPKPSFDPSKPFQPADEKPDFNPSQPFDAGDKPADISIDPRAALAGFGNGAAMGYLPQLQAAVGGLIPNPSADVDAKLKAQGFTIQQPEDTYLSRRDEAAGQIADYAKNSPGSYYGGMLGGAVASSPAVGAALKGVGIAPAAKDAGLGAKLLQATKSGAAIGAVQNPGDGAGQFEPIQFDQRIKNAETGGAIGAGTQLVASAVTGAINKIRGIPDFINDFAETRAAKAAGATKADLKGSLQFDKSGDAGGTLRQLGRYALDNKLVRPGDTVQDVVDRSSDLKEVVGKRLGDVYERAAGMASNPEVVSSLSDKERQLLASTDFNPREMAKDFLETVTKDYSGSPNGSEVINRATRLADNLSQNGEVSDIMKIHDFRSELDDMIFRSDKAFKQSGVVTPGDEAMGEMRDFVSKKIMARTNALDSVFKGTLGDDLRAANKAYSSVSKINSMAKNSLSAHLGNQMFSPTDKGAGMLGAGLGAVEGYNKDGIPGAIKGGLMGGLAGLASKGVRTFGPALVTSGTNLLNQGLGAVGDSALGTAASAAYPALLNGVGLMSSPAVAGRAAALANQPQVQDYSTIPGRYLGGSK
jgi:hypothetical protein